MHIAGLTNQGLERSRNEDNWFARQEENMALLVVADGMGGHRAGNVASAIAVNEAEAAWEKAGQNDLKTVESARSILSDYILDANRKILDEAENHLERRGMGTTLTAALLNGKMLTIGHVGDSRAYLIRGNELTLVTRDHSLVEQLVKSGQISPDEAEGHPQKHVLTRALGVTGDLEIDFTDLEVEPSSTLLLCTDGLTNMVRDSEILSLFLEESDPPRLAEALINKANSRGGLDNITVVIAAGIGGLNPDGR